MFEIMINFKSMQEKSCQIEFEIYFTYLEMLGKMNTSELIQILIEKEKRNIVFFNRENKIERKQKQKLLCKVYKTNNSSDFYN